MKPEEFEHTLKELSGDFNLPVSNKMFDAMMEKRSKQRRKKKILAWIGSCSVAAVLTFFAAFHFIPSAHTGLNNGDHTTAVVREKPQTGSADKTTDYDQPQEKAAAPETLHQPETGSAKPAQPATPLTRATTAAAPANSDHGANTKNNIAEVGKSTSPRNVLTSRPGIAGNTPAGKHKTPSAAVLASAGSVVNNEPGKGKDTNVATAISQEKKAEATAEKETSPAAEDKNGSKENTTPGKTETTPKEETTTVPDLSKTEMASSNNGATDSAAAPPTPQAITAKPHKWMIGIYGDYTPVTSVKNSNAAIPLPHTDSLGLSDKANAAFSAGLTFGYSISDRWKINIGLGYHQVQFDKVRFASNVKIDSTYFENTHNQPGSLKSSDGYFYAYNISDRSLGWMQVPLSVNFTATPQKRVSFYTQAGVIYQLLVQSKGYEFTTSYDSLKYEEVSNKGFNRINKNQFALFVEPGIKIHITPRIHYQAGITYRRHLTSLYKKEYHSNSPAYYIGISSALNFIF